MSLPAAIVTVTLRELSPLPATLVRPGKAVYAIAKIGSATVGFFNFGRSRYLAAGATSIDFSAEPMTWVHSVAVSSTDAVEVIVEIWENGGDTAPRQLTSFTEQISPPWLAQPAPTPASRRLHFEVDTRPTASFRQAFAARVGGGSSAGAVLRVPRELLVEIIEIRGLYEPGFRPIGGTNPRLAEHHDGYSSLDNLGRVYINRDLAGNWAKDEQLIEVTARVTVRGMALPADAKIRWTLSDPDEPFDDRTDCHSEWRPYIDRADFDAAGNFLGASGDDNLHSYSSTTLGTRADIFDRDPRWEQVAPYSLTVTSDEQADTVIQAASRLSKVRVHCPNVGGTNFVLEADVQTTDAATIFPAQTGIMTMWKRIDVEVTRMAGAPSLSGSLAHVAGFLEPANVQLDFAPENIVSGALNRSEMAGSKSTLTATTNAWTNNSSVFSHAGQGGWFFLGAARFPYRLPVGGAGAPLYDGTTYILGTTGNRVWIRIPGAHPNAKYVRMNWRVGAHRRNAGFNVARATVSGVQTTLVLRPNDVIPRFTGHDADGAISHAYRTRILYYPRHQKPSGAALIPGGFGVPTAGVRIRVGGPGSTFVTGISPSVPHATTGSGSYFAGRTVLFTHTPKFSSGSPPTPRGDFDSKVLGTVVHEFLHAFGMPHKCGHWNWQTPRDKSCCMNYFSTWLIDMATDRLIPGTIGKQGDHMCGRHLMEVRRVHLEDNPGLNW